MDGSRNTHHAARVAVELAERKAAELDVINVVLMLIDTLISMAYYFRIIRATAFTKPTIYLSEDACIVAHCNASYDLPKPYH